MIRLQVEYCRDVNDGDGYTSFAGVVNVYSGEKKDPEFKTSFESTDFPTLIRNLHDLMGRAVKAADGDDDVNLRFIRTDRPELQPYDMDPWTTKLILDRPEMAIEALSHPDVRVVVGRNPQPMSNIRAGTETLASSFGEMVAVRRKGYGNDPHVGHRVECPGCGRWSGFASKERASMKHATLTCKCGMCTDVLPVDDQWAMVSVEDLLAHEHARFFLPREWNNFEPWVTREKLEELLTNFRMEKDNVR